MIPVQLHEYFPFYTVDQMLFPVPPLGAVQIHEHLFFDEMCIRDRAYTGAQNLPDRATPEQVDHGNRSHRQGHETGNACLLYTSRCV